MKTTVNFRKSLIAAIMLLSALSFTACSASDDSNSAVAEVSKEVAKAENAFAFKLKALSADEDVTIKGNMGSAELFIFDKNNDFVKKVSVDRPTILNKRTIQVTCPGSDRITIIAWGGMNGQNENVTAMTTANIISDLTVSLKNNNGIANLPSDIFYGQITLNSNQTKSDDVAVFPVSRKTAAFDLLVTNVAKKFGTTEGDFYVKVKQTKNTFNASGEATGESVEYIIPANITATGAVAIDKVAIMPTSITSVELYRNDVMVSSIDMSKNAKFSNVAAGSQVAVNYDITRASVAVEVAAWGVAQVWASIG